VSYQNKQSPYFNLFSRDVVLPLDNLLKPRQKYHGEDYSKIILSENHRAFLSAYRLIKKTKRNRNEKVNKNRQDITFKINDAIYYKNFNRASKLDPKWILYYRIIDHPSPLTYVIKSVLDQKIIHCHARQIRLANILEWDIPTTHKNRRACNYVVPPKDQTSSNDSLSDSTLSAPTNDNTDVNQTSPEVLNRYNHQLDESDDLNHVPLSHLQNQLHANDHQSISNSSSSNADDNIPLSVLQQKLRYRPQTSHESTTHLSSNDHQSDNNELPHRYKEKQYSSSDTESYDFDINAVCKPKQKKLTHKRSKSTTAHKAVNKLLVECLAKVL
jgi:hypothetical protein